MQRASARIFFRLRLLRPRTFCLRKVFCRQTASSRRRTSFRLKNSFHRRISFRLKNFSLRQASYRRKTFSHRKASSRRKASSHRKACPPHTLSRLSFLRMIFCHYAPAHRHGPILTASFFCRQSLSQVFSGQMSFPLQIILYIYYGIQNPGANLLNSSQ